MPRIAFTATISLWQLLSLGACTTTNVAEPADATTPGGAEQHADVADDSDAPQPTVSIGSGPAATTTTTTTTTSKPTQPYACQAPLVVIEEVTRLLTVAGTHATRSAACVDGPGQRVTLDEILVCPLGRDGARRSFGVTYRVSTWDEGGRQACAGKCPPVEAEHTFHRIDVAFVAGKGGFVIEPPKAVPGLPLDATALTAAHDGDCYGPSAAFEPRAIPLR